jgi:hypothetical protein
MILAPGSIWKVFKVVRAVLKSLVQGRSLGRSNRPQAVRSQAGGLTALCRVSRFLPFVEFPCCIAALVQGECALA